MRFQAYIDYINRLKDLQYNISEGEDKMITSKQTKVAYIIIVLGLMASFSSFAAGEKTARDRQTLVFARHAEKPPIEIGQLNCQGLNRSLKLPKVFLEKFGKPDFLFAPSPSTFKNVAAAEKQFGKNVSYTRPLTTIEPLAIQLDMPVNAQIAFDDVDTIAKTLLDAKYDHNLIFIDWEHKHLVKIVQKIFDILGSEQIARPWPQEEYDNFYILTITKDKKGNRKVEFKLEHQGLNGQPETCPDQTRT